MAFYRKKLYEPDSKEFFKVSRSKIDLFIECPRCFYLDRRLGIGRPAGFPFNLNSAVDSGNFRVQKFTSTGVYLLQWGGQGSEGEKFVRPWGIASDSLNNIYVVDNGFHAVKKFNSSGVFLLKWGTGGTGDGQFSKPNGVAVDQFNHVYVADSTNNRIQKFNSNGVYISQWGTGGTGDGQFKLPFGVDVDAEGSVFVADTSNNRIQKFTNTGIFVTKFGALGVGDGQLQFPQGLEVGTNGIVYVADTLNNRVQQFAKPCGRITVIKKVDPFPDSKDFTFTRNFGANFLLDDDNNPTLSNEITFEVPSPNNNFVITEICVCEHNVAITD